MKCVILDNKIESINVLEDTQYILDITEDVSVKFVFNKSDVNAHIIGIYKLDKDKRLNINLCAIHKVKNTSCVIDVKGVLYDESFSHHTGEIHIDKGGIGTESYLNDHTLLLGDKCRTIAIPNLQIKNNEVIASHGSSIGPVDKDKIYYLQSRGLGEKESMDIIVNGFFESTFNEIADQNMAKELRQKMLTSQH